MQDIYNVVGQFELTPDFFLPMFYSLFSVLEQIFPIIKLFLVIFVSINFIIIIARALLGHSNNK